MLSLQFWYFHLLVDSRPRNLAQLFHGLSFENQIFQRLSFDDVSWHGKCLFLFRYVGGEIDINFRSFELFKLIGIRGLGKPIILRVGNIETWVLNIWVILYYWSIKIVMRLLETYIYGIRLYFGCLKLIRRSFLGFEQLRVIRLGYFHGSETRNFIDFKFLVG